MARDLDATFYEPIAVVLSAADRPLTFATGIGPATAFVLAGEPHGGRQVLYYEEPRDGLTFNFADRVLHAHGRAWNDRPRGDERRWPCTHRLLAARTGEITRIGTYDPREGEITLAPDPALRDQLIAWLGLAHSDDPAGRLTAELQTTSSVEHDIRREIRRAIANGATLSPTLRQLARRHGHDDLLGEEPEQP
jgi:hypothetical protein